MIGAKAARARIAQRDGAIRAYVHIGDSAYGGSGLLAGLALAVKDTIDVAGWPTEANCRLFRGRIAREDAAVVARLRALGAVPLGKVSTWELGAGTGEVQELALAPPPAHPFVRGAFVGGSSSGSAVAVAARMADVALGGDTGGSVRCPAAACGVVGLKPSAGLLPRDGVLAHSGTLDHVGLIGGDAMLLARVVTFLGASLHEAPRYPRIAVIRAWDRETHPDVAAALSLASQHLADAGANLIEAEAPIGIDSARTLVSTIALPESAALHGNVLAAPVGMVSEGLRAWLRPGLAIDQVARKAAMAQRAALTATVDALLANCDAILCAGHLHRLPDASDEAACIAYCLASPNCVFNLTGHPALSVPAGIDGRGRPIGLQLVGAMGADAALLRIAALIQEPSWDENLGLGF
ncbi:amidase [Roseomonas fluvialis]|uniref:Glutamyl-tRNA(Gln) amidotransferase n=1 Tax=Roseomonas fluvialis TaxID=1750527 RepID=A0ABM7XYF8_9PROT|nr:amidase [Roseomonas fluvialis]BDG70492.1 glutamyl-tRNA(Gln) amidotransferase [Roseomonas fluvialis]